MSALLLALALMTDPAPVAVVDPTTMPPAVEIQAPPSEVPPAADPAPPPVAEPEPAPVAVVETPYPPDAPKDDYGLVAWCYGLLSGYLELHDRVLPEVTRIEGAFRKPGTSLADDMAVYEDMQKVSRSNMKLFERAMEAAERASIRPINQAGAAAVARGRSTWSAAANLPTRIVAQQWMGWTLPGVCPTRAEALETRAKLMGLTFKVNEPSPEAAAAEAPPLSAAAEPTAPPPQEVAPAAPAPTATDEAAAQTAILTPEPAMDTPHLVYFSDPMCSWCYGFSPVIADIRKNFGRSLPIRLVMGGLRPGTETPMTEAAKTEIRGHWTHVAEAAHLPFDGAVLDHPGFRYDTDPAARAVVRVRRQDPELALTYLERVQRAFYAENRNVTEAGTLADLAGELGFDRDAFLADMDSDDLKNETWSDYGTSQRAGVTGFPTLVAGPNAQGAFGVVTRGWQPGPQILAVLHAWIEGPTAGTA